MPAPVFDVYRRMYSYDKGPLSPTTVRVDDSHPDWRRQLVSYAAAYGNERIPAHVFLPKQGKPPFQVVV